MIQYLCNKVPELAIAKDNTGLTPLDYAEINVKKWGDAFPAFKRALKYLTEIIEKRKE